MTKLAFLDALKFAMKNSTVQLDCEDVGINCDAVLRLIKKGTFNLENKIHYEAAEDILDIANRAHVISYASQREAYLSLNQEFIVRNAKDAKHAQKEEELYIREQLKASNGHSELEAWEQL